MSEGNASTPSSRPTSAVGSTSADVDALRELIDAETSRALRRREGEEELARLEAIAALEAILTRMPDVRFADRPVVWSGNTILRGPVELPLRY